MQAAPPAKTRACVTLNLATKIPEEPTIHQIRERKKAPAIVMRGGLRRQPATVHTLVWIFGETDLDLRVVVFDNSRMSLEITEELIAWQPPEAQVIIHLPVV